MKNYNVTVLGAGSAGLVAATTANRLGAKTLLIEKNKIGGECLHTGCVPSKTLIHSAKIFHEINNSTQFGLPQIDIDSQLSFQHIMDHVRSTIGSIYKHENEDVFKKMGIDVKFGEPRFVSPTELTVGDEVIRSDYFIICTGSSPVIPEISGLDNIEYFTNENIWNIHQHPDQLLILGGGPIGIEMAQAFSRLGSKVSVAVRSGHILKKEEQEVSHVMETLLEKEGITFLKHAKINQFQLNNKQIEVEYEIAGQRHKNEFDGLLVAIGRSPNLESLNLDQANVGHDKKGVLVDNYLQTSNSHIYACGDVLGRHLYTHAAAYYAETAVNNILNTHKLSIDRSVIPWVTFTDPEIAQVGETEKSAGAKYEHIHVIHINCTLDRFVTENETEGFLKIILDKDQKILGAHCIGSRGGEFIQHLTLAIQNNLTIQQIVNTVFPYPTFSEIVKKAFVRFLREKK